jgi:hypothetical protein
MAASQSQWASGTRRKLIAQAAAAGTSSATATTRKNPDCQVGMNSSTP